ncbi:MAG: hypothetical protein KDC05_16985 [Bacteroidales bacterium]|nr:hypothetical protein [Bacteroidales bacterium]
MFISFQQKKPNITNGEMTYKKGHRQFLFRGYFSFENKMYLDKDACRFINEKVIDEGTIDPANLNGIFLLIIINEHRSLIHILNDRFGFYHFFYSRSKEGILIGDNFWEVAMKAGSQKTDEISVAEFLQFRFVSGKDTLAKDVFCIEPASLYTIDFGGDETSIKRTEYWKFAYTPAEFSEKEAEEAIHSTLATIIKRYKTGLFENKRIGLNLTGGYDSRYLLALLLQQTEKSQLKTFTFGSAECDDMEIVRELVEKLKLPAHLEIFDPYFRDFFRTSNISEILKEIGFFTYYLQGYGIKKLEEKYRNIDYLLTGSDGYFIGLNANEQLFGLKDSDQLAEYIFKINATMLSPEEAKLVLKEADFDPKGEVLKKVKDALSGFDGDPISAFFDWTLKNRHRKYLMSIYEIQSRHALHLMPFYDYDFIDLMAKLPYNLLKDQKAYINALMKMALTDDLSILKEVPFELRGKLVVSGENFQPKKRSKFTFANLRSKMLNPPDPTFQYPIQQTLRKFPEIWDTIHNELQMSNSKYLDPEKCIALIDKNKRSNIFTRYGMVVILSVIRFEKLLTNNPFREQ